MSEQASPLHHDPATLPARSPGRFFSQLNLDVVARDRATVLVVLAMTAILIIGGVFRLTHNNWDASGEGGVSGHLHPDERFLTQILGDVHAPSSPLNYFDTDTSALNPYNITYPDGRQQEDFVYGTLPIFLNKFVATNTSLLTLGTLDDYDDYDHYHLAGRALSGLFDLGTVLLVFFLGWALVNRGAGVMGAFLYAVAPFPIQNSHFFIVDPYLTFFATFTILFAVRSAQHGGYRNFVLAGIGAGLATACKTTALALLPVVILAIGIHAWPAVRPYLLSLWAGDRDAGAGERNGRRLDRAIVTLIAGSLAALVAGFIAYRIAMPYAFNSPSLVDLFSLRTGHLGPVPFPYPDIINQHWVRDLQDQQRLLSGDGAFPPNVQWIGRSKWLWPLQQMVAWGMGPAFGITAWIGVAFAAGYAVWRRAWVWLVPLAWVLGYFFFMGAQFSLYMRYFLPLYPTLAVFAAFVLFKALEWGASAQPMAAFGRFQEPFGSLKPVAFYGSRIAVGAVLVLTLAAGAAFYSIYTEPVSRVSASKWIFENVPEGSVIGHEHWDDQVPYTIAGVEPRRYESVEFKNFGIDSEQRVEELLADVEAVDYIALASARLSGTVTRVPAQWPVTTRYYEALESGELGFNKVGEFTSYPEIFGIEFNDTGSEESFTVYDHPQVYIYEKTDAYSPERARDVLGADAFVPGLPALPGKARENGIMFTPDVAERQQEGGTWSDIFDAGSVVNDHPLFFWLLAMELAALALVPMAIVLFRGLPDRGFLLTKPLGILLLSFLVYVPASYGIVDFTRPVIIGALIVMLAGGALAALRWQGEITAWLRERWRFVLFAQGFYLIMFAGAYWIRLQNPDLWHPSRGGEKPMDLAYLTGVIRTTDMTQGAIDPWNAGGYLNYYYYGQFIAATVTKMLGIVPEVAYNLIVPMFFALAAAATFSVAYNLAEGVRGLMRRRPGGLAIHPSGPLLCALLAVFLVLLSGNIKAADVLASNLQSVSPWHPDIPIIGPLLTIIGGMFDVAFGDATLRQVAFTYDWWDPSRALDVQSNDEVTPITEFPFWTFLFADLHAHLIAIPFALTAIGVGLAGVMNFTRLNPHFTEKTKGAAMSREAASWIIVVLLAVIVGALRWINSWDYPTFLLLGAAAILLAERAKEGRVHGRMIAMGLAKLVAFGALSFLFFAPFATNYHMAYSGFESSKQTTELEDFFGHFGILLALMTGFALVMLYRALSRDRWLRLSLFGSDKRGGRVDATPVLGMLILAALVAVWFATSDRNGVIAFSAVGLIAMLLLAWRAVRSPSPDAPILAFVYAMVGLGFGLTGGVELYTLKGDIGRMNTVFKFYLHVWELWGIAAAFGTWYVFGVLRPQRALSRARLYAPLSSAPARYAFGAAVVLLLLVGMVFPYFGTRARIHDRFDPAQGTGVNGMEYMDETVYLDFDDRTGKGGEHVLKYERDAITWMRRHVEGTPTTIEAVTPIYHYGSRFTIYTGLPAVGGWQWHQEQQRRDFHEAVALRHADVNNFYTTTDVGQARQILERYGVSYVIVGAVERAYYPEEGIDKFNGGLGGMLELAYANEGVQIWHVIPEAELQASR